MQENTRGRLSKIALTIGLTSLLWSCGESTPPQEPVNYLSVSLDSTEAINASAHKVGQMTAAWQLAHMDDFFYIKTKHKQTRDTRNWIQGALYIGLDRWADTVNDQNIIDHIAGMKALERKVAFMPW